MLKIDIKNVLNFISIEELGDIQKEINFHHLMLLNKKGKGSDFLGWLTLPDEENNALIDEIIQSVAAIQNKISVMIVIGIGGSYLGSKALLEALNSDFQFWEETQNPKIIFAGQNISEDYHAALLRVLDKQEYAITVISKSGTTTEPAIAFRLLKSHLENKYGKDEARKRIIAITDKEKGALKKLANKEGYKTFIIPDNVGGRFSVLTPVGLLPLAVAGYDIKSMMKGALDMKTKLYADADINKNPAAMYAAIRNSLYRRGKPIEILVNYLPNLVYLTEWWKQLYGESEGKQHRGIFPAGVSFTTDLHSMGQYIQDGLRVIFETVISVEQPKEELYIPIEETDDDGLNFIGGKRLHNINHKAETATTLAHVDGGVPVIRIVLPKIDEYNLGALIYFFEFACALSGYILEVNPFDQPGVEDYKRNMFALLGKPGFEKETEEILKRIS